MERHASAVGECGALQRQEDGCKEGEEVVKR